MSEEEVLRKLNSIGKAIFVQYFSIFKDYAEGKMTKECCIELMIVNGISNKAGAVIRCGNAKLLFESNKEWDALVIVSESNRLSIDIVRSAKQLINEHYN